MKELSIEEKARAYDEAVINGSRLWECDKITREDYEFIFPTLKESDDERIRENIIATIHLYYGEPLEDEAKEMIDWLEKRCQTFNKKDIEDAYLKGVCDAKHEIEKQGKNDMGISEATKQKLEDNLNKALEKEAPESWNKFLDEQGEQKPATWSEEDELYIRELESLVKQVWATAEHKNDKDTIHKMSDLSFFLKTLKPQNTWKPSDLPHWQKSTLPNDNTTGFNSDYFCHKGYNINYKELFEKLPKDD